MEFKCNNKESGGTNLIVPWRWSPKQRSDVSALDTGKQTGYNQDCRGGERLGPALPAHAQTYQRARTRRRAGKPRQTAPHLRPRAPHGEPDRPGEEGAHDGFSDPHRPRSTLAARRWGASGRYPPPRSPATALAPCRFRATMASR